MNLSRKVVELLRNFAALEAGQSLVYYQGHIGHDRINPDIAVLAEMALRFATPYRYPVRPMWGTSHDRQIDVGLGTGDLTQRKVAEFIYEYRITKRQKTCENLATDRDDEKAKEAGLAHGGGPRRRLG